MATSSAIIFAVILGIAVLPSIQCSSEPLVPEILGLLGGDSDGLLGPDGLPKFIAKLLCDLFGPAFLRVFYNSCKECNGVILSPPGGCKSFCEYFKKSSRQQQDCMTTYMTHVKAKLSPLIDLNLAIANCCPPEHC